ncbi:kinase-like protein [Anaeromyces robustus]|uniref:non-specific serine/threonine protein kinase n=1 Tax=Anaeromyces robustus TaxID=1754192 RepID=A0A1Y1X5B2_9FUNG|nr:kinase-like protein [Anaeromyces robustus]|eukprot:ORX80963.1 kinase-like protein [Anaeromyces robustus]
MSLEVSMNFIENKSPTSLNSLLKEKRNSLQMTKINDISEENNNSHVYPIITVDNSENMINIPKNENKENVVNNNTINASNSSITNNKNNNKNNITITTIKNDNNTNTNNDILDNKNDNNTNNNKKNENNNNTDDFSSIKNKKNKSSLSLKLTNSFLSFKKKSNRMNLIKTTHSFLMTPLFHKKDSKKNTNKNNKLNVRNANTYAESEKRKSTIRVNSKLSMNSSPGEPNYFSDKNGKKLKRKDFSESIKELGSGATGKIHLVYKKDNPDKYYALKEFIVPQHKLNQANERKFFKHLQSEYTIGTILHHRNVIEVENFIYNDYYKRNRKERHVYQVMEYCNSGDLFDAIQNGNMSQGNILCFFKQLMEGLAYIHSMGVAHRDLKPENIMFKDNKILKILDFGAAIMFKTPYSNEIIRCTGIVGSEPYMAPEQFSLKAYDPRTVDIWSCGIIFLAMFYNELPWKSAILSNKKYKVWVEKGISEIINDLPNGPKQLITRMLEPDPEKRITMEEIFKDKWFKNINCCLDNENGILDYSRYNHSQISYSPSFLNSCLRRNVSSQSNTSTTAQTLMNKSGCGSSIKFSDSVLSSGASESDGISDVSSMKISEKTKIEDENSVKFSPEINQGKKAVFSFESDSDEEKDEEKESESPTSSSNITKDNNKVKVEETMKKKKDDDEELKSLWGLDLTCSHEIKL